MATLGGSSAPKGTYGLPSQAQLERSRAERRRWSRRVRLAWGMYWIALAALFAAGIAGLATGTTWLVVAAVTTGLVILVAATGIGVRTAVRGRRRRGHSGR